MTLGGDIYEIGSIGGQGNVSMARNKHVPVQIAIVTEDGANYVLEDNVLKVNPDDDLQVPNSVAFLNGYFVYSHRDGRITSTAIDNALDVNPLNYDTAEFNSDKLLKIAAKGSQFVGVW